MVTSAVVEVGHRDVQSHAVSGGATPPGSSLVIKYKLNLSSPPGGMRGGGGGRGGRGREESRSSLGA